MCAGRKAGLQSAHPADRRNHAHVVSLSAHLVNEIDTSHGQQAALLQTGLKPDGLAISGSFCLLCFFVYRGKLLG